MKSLFDNNFRYTNTAANLDAEANSVIKPIFDRYVDIGYSPREISCILSNMVNDLECEAVLSKGIKP